MPAPDSHHSVASLVSSQNHIPFRRSFSCNYDAFDAYYRDGKADDMVLLVAEYVGERLDRYLEIVKE